MNKFENELKFLTVCKYFALGLHFVVVCCDRIATDFYPYHSGLHLWYWNHTISPVQVKQSWMIWIHEQPEFKKN